MLSVADGQLAVSATAMYTNPATSPNPANVTVCATCQNTSSSTTETVILTLLRNGGTNTARRIARAILGPNEQLFVTGIPLAPGDILKGQTTDATTVDFVVSTTAAEQFACWTLDTNGNVKQNQASAGALTVGGNLTLGAGAQFISSETGGITAHSGGTQASAVLLSSGYNVLGTVAAQGDSVKLPLAVVGMEVTIDNRGANASQVFGSGTDTVNSIATATGISHGVNQIATYFCTASAPGGNWDVQFSQPQQAGLVALSGTADAIPPHVGHTYVVTKAGVDAMTLAAPTATTDDGLIIIVTSNTANAHTITATGLLQCGTASVNVATFAAQKGAGLTLMAYQGKWNVLASVGITFS